MSSKWQIVSACLQSFGIQVIGVGINSPAMKQTLPILIFIPVFFLLSFGANAQWAWVDKDGKKVFSDRAPSADVPDKNVFKRPSKNATAHIATASNEANDTGEKVAVTAKVAASKPVAGVDKELADRMKKAELEQAAKKKTEEERIGKIKAENCQRAKLAQKNLDSGVRLSRINAQGEREVMDDAARTVEAKRLQGIAESECK